jgi:pyruvate formate lyase activating enzyme
MVEAWYYRKVENNAVECYLCPHHCAIQSEKLGVCGVRKNVDGELKALGYGRLSAVHSDPIEKKPLYHFYPGSVILSLGGYGCNMRCSFCQNCDISQVKLVDYQNYKYYSPDSIIQKAKHAYNNLGIAYTYNEPSIWYEYMFDVAKTGLEHGLKNIMITNGYIEKVPLNDLLPVMHAFNVDLKAFSNGFYQKVTGSSIYPVQKALEIIKSNDKHLEITNLIIPDLNDDKASFKTMIQWIASNLGKDTILHLSRYFPMHRLDKEATPPQVLIDFYEIARDQLWYVYLGNLQTNTGRHTHCHQCGNKIIQRTGYSTHMVSPLKNGRCQECGTEVPIVQEI